MGAISKLTDCVVYDEEVETVSELICAIFRNTISSEFRWFYINCADKETMHVQVLHKGCLVVKANGLDVCRQRVSVDGVN